MRKAIIIAFIGIGLMMAAPGPTALAQEQPIGPKDILDCLEAIKYDLLKAQKPDGSWEDCAWSAAPGARAGGQTALVAWALLQAGQDPFSEPIRKAVQYLLSIENQMAGTYNRSLRCMVLASLARIDPVGRYASAMQRDVDFLLSSRLANGRWSYVPVGRSTSSPSPDVSGIGDNSNTQFAILALREAAVAGARIPANLWREIRTYWQASQNEDGGFEYRDPRKGSYGSMTGAGTASLFIAEDMIRGSQCCVGELPEPISRALGWLSTNFDAQRNPRHHEFWLYWMYSVERVAETSGYRYFGSHDWFREGAAAIVKARSSGGLNDYAAASLSGRAFALIFLAKSVSPMVCNKLEFGKTWNPNPLDATHMTRYLASDVFERHLNWQIIRLDAPLAMFHEAPILLITTKTWPVQTDSLTQDLMARIYPFCESGGTLLVDRTCQPDKDFRPNFQAFLKGLWPNRALRPLPADHPIYTAHFALEARIPLLGLGNGCREYVILYDGDSTTDLSCTWQRGIVTQQPQTFQIAANILMYATDKAFRNKLEPRSWLARTNEPPARRLAVGRVLHAGNDNPCPLALPMLSQVLVAQAGLGLQIDNVKLEAASLAGQQVLVLAGQGRMDWTTSQIQAVRKFINDGGAVLGEALMGDKDFAESLRRLAAGATMLPPRPIPESDPLITGAFRQGAFHLGRLHYSRQLRWRKGITGPATLEGCKAGSRWGFVISPYDLTNGLTTARPFGVLGYEPDDATRVAGNCMLYFAETAKKHGNGNNDGQG